MCTAAGFNLKVMRLAVRQWISKCKWSVSEYNRLSRKSDIEWNIQKKRETALAEVLNNHSRIIDLYGDDKDVQKYIETLDPSLIRYSDLCNYLKKKKQ